MAAYIQPTGVPVLPGQQCPWPASFVLLLLHAGQSQSQSQSYSTQANPNPITWGCDETPSERPPKDETLTHESFASGGC